LLLVDVNLFSTITRGSLPFVGILEERSLRPFSIESNFFWNFLDLLAGRGSSTFLFPVKVVALPYTSSRTVTFLSLQASSTSLDALPSAMAQWHQCSTETAVICSPGRSNSCRRSLLSVLVMTVGPSSRVTSSSTVSHAILANTLVSVSLHSSSFSGMVGESV